MSKTHSDIEGHQRDTFHSGKSFGQKWNFLIVGVLVLIVLAAFFWRVQKTKQGFLDRATEQSRMLVGLVSFSLKNAKHSQDALEKTIHSFLVSTAKFADYLDSVEPFTTEELSSFANEATLAGIKLLHYYEADVEGPPGWSPDISCEPSSSALLHFPEKKLYLLVWPATEPGCVLVGYNSTDTDRLMDNISLERLMNDLTELPLIEYVRLQKKEASQPIVQDSGARLLTISGRQVAQSQIQFDSDTVLIVGVDASRYTKRIQQLFEEFFLFSILLTCLGGFFSWLISRNQAVFFKQVQSFERELARQHEEAALGRAVAIITHEIKNPLNAISMGLQRFDMEVELPEQYKKLLVSMSQAVSRTNNIVSDLKQYSQPIVLHSKHVSPNQIIEDVVILYQAKCEEIGILVTFEDRFKGTIYADKAMLGQVFENVLKNAIEAQPGGGYIRIETAGQQNTRFVWSIENPGFLAEEKDMAKILEPYFTTKTQGTGLGLDVSRRIVESHGGVIVLSQPIPGVLKVTIKLPIHPEINSISGGRQA